MMSTLRYDFDELPLFRVTKELSTIYATGTADIGFVSSTEWWVEAIGLDGDRRTGRSVMPKRVVIEVSPRTPATAPWFKLIADALEREHRGYIEDAIRDYDHTQDHEDGRPPLRLVAGGA